jgi:hypothetical protein
VNARRQRARGTGGRPAGDASAFERWLGDGLAPDASDAAAGRMLADAWRDRRRAMDGSAAGTVAFARRRRAWWWASMTVAATTVAAVVLVAVVAWPTPAAVDGSALAASYLEAMGTLPSGAP